MDKSDLYQTIKQLRKQNETRKAEIALTQESMPLTFVQNPISKPQPKKQIQKIRSQREKSGTYEITSVRQVFKGINFCFPIKDLDLSPAVIKILTKNILAYGGSIFDVSDEVDESECNIYLVSPKVKRQQLIQKIGHKVQNVYYSCLDYHYVTYCYYQKVLLPQESYMLEHLDGELLRRREQQARLKKQQEHRLYVQMINDPKNQKMYVYRNFQNDRGMEVLAQCRKESFLKDVPEYDFNAPAPKPKPLIIRQYQPPQQKKKPTSNSNQFIKNATFSAFQKESEKPSTPSKTKDNNNMIIKQLNKLYDIYRVQKDRGRAIAYSKAINAIKGLPFDIQSVKDVDGIEGIGEKLKLKIKELLQTGKLQKIQDFQKDEKYSIAHQLQRVWGIGPTKAVELYNRGIKTIEELRKNEHLLAKNQLLGLKYLEQFQQKIPRQQVGIVQRIVEHTVFDVAGTKNCHTILACGSYRRGKEQCGDIDIIITRFDGLYEKDMLVRLVKRLTDNGFLTDNLTQPKQSKDEGACQNYMGVCQLQGRVHRRIDIKYYYYQEFAFALLHFTGSDAFNRSLRLLAQKKGLSLSDKMMIPTSEKDDKNKDSKKVLCFDEKDIFDFLGVQYREPKDRDVF